MIRPIAHILNAVRVNSIVFQRVDGRPAWVKRRRTGMGPVIACGNLFLEASKARIRMFPASRDWQDWESQCFRLLNADSYRCGIKGQDVFWSEPLPGVSLKACLEAGGLTDAMLRSAAQEFRRVHALNRPRVGGPWSHGDPALANLLYEERTARSRFIDFETIHEQGLSADERHADDLLVFLLDLLGRAPDASWLGSASVFLAAYGRPSVARELQSRLKLPSGLERLLWVARAAGSDARQLGRRIAALSRLKGQGGPEGECGES